MQAAESKLPSERKCCLGRRQYSFPHVHVRCRQAERDGFVNGSCYVHARAKRAKGHGGGCARTRLIDKETRGPHNNYTTHGAP